VATVLDRDLPRQRDDPRFGGGIRADAFLDQHGCAGRHVHEHAAALRQHRRQRRACDEEVSAEIDRQRALPAGGIEVADAAGNAAGGIVVHDVESAEGFHRRPHHGVGVDDARDVGAQSARHWSAELVDEPLRGVAIQVGDDDPCTLGNQAARRGGADSRRPPVINATFPSSLRMPGHLPAELASTRSAGRRENRWRRCALRC